MEQQAAISLLQRILADRDLEIDRLRAQQQGQVKELEVTTSKAARAEVKLRRFASEAEVASRLAEVEVAMEGLLSGGREVSPQLMPQPLLDAASAAFNRGELSVAADLAAQAEQLIGMLINIDSTPDPQSATEVPFKIAIALRTKVDARLRRQPHLDAAILGVLQQGTPVVARAYNGRWLRVETEDGSPGWILGKLLELP